MEGQRFMRERVLALGPDLAAAYFLLGRGCRVRFKHQKGMFQSKYLSCSLTNFLESAIFCHLALWRKTQSTCKTKRIQDGKRPKVHAKQKGFKNFFSAHRMQHSI